jgi:hypothetical protein
VLHERLTSIEELQIQFTEYQLSYNKLVVEMGRRLQYREAAENIVRGMIDQLAAMTEGLCPILSRDPRPSEIYCCGFAFPAGPLTSQQKNARRALLSMQNKGLIYRRTYPSALRICQPGGTSSQSMSIPLRVSRAVTERNTANFYRQ